MSVHVLELVAITLFAAIVNGGLGYGFSSITVPLALLFVNRDALGAVWKRVLPIVIGLLPGVIVGTMIVTSVSPAWLKLGTYLVLLPLILVQAAGFRRPIRSERAIGL